MGECPERVYTPKTCISLFLGEELGVILTPLVQPWLLQFLVFPLCEHELLRNTEI